MQTVCCAAACYACCRVREQKSYTEAKSHRHTGDWECETLTDPRCVCGHTPSACELHDDTLVLLYTASTVHTAVTRAVSHCNCELGSHSGKGNTVSNNKPAVARCEWPGAAAAVALGAGWLLLAAWTLLHRCYQQSPQQHVSDKVRAMHI